MWIVRGQALGEPRSLIGFSRLGEDVLGKPTDTCKDYKNSNGREITQDEYIRMSLSINGHENGITC